MFSGMSTGVEYGTVALGTGREALPQKARSPQSQSESSRCTYLPTKAVHQRYQTHRWDAVLSGVPTQQYYVAESTQKQQRRHLHIVTSSSASAFRSGLQAQRLKPPFPERARVQQHRATCRHTGLHVILANLARLGSRNFPSCRSAAFSAPGGQKFPIFLWLFYFFLALVAFTIMKGTHALLGHVFVCVFIRLCKTPPFTSWRIVLRASLLTHCPRLQSLSADLQSPVQPCNWASTGLLTWWNTPFSGPCPAQMLTGLALAMRDVGPRS